MRGFMQPIGLGVLALIIVNSLEISLPLIIRQVVDSFATGGTQTMLISYAAGYVGIAVLQCGCRFTWRWALALAGVGAAHEARLVLGEVATRPGTKAGIGEMASLTTSDAENFGRAFDSGVVIFVDAVFLAASIPCVLFWLDPWLALKVLAPLPVVSFLVLKFDNLIKGRYAAVQNKMAALSTLATESLGNLRTIKANTSEPTFLERFERTSHELASTGGRQVVTEAVFSPSLESFVSLSLIILIVAGGHDVVAGTLTVGTFLAVQKYIERLLWPMNAIAIAVTTYKKAAVSAVRISDAARIKFDNEVDYEVREPHVPRRGVALQSDHLIVRLPESKIELLSNVTFEIPAKDRIAIIGPVGSGKSTLTHVLGGLIPVSSGAISTKVNGNVSTDLFELRRAVCVVPQDLFLFGMTVRENLSFGLPPRCDEFADEQELWWTLEIAALRVDIENLPAGLDTVLGERGLSLSGGQRQRLTLARALLRKAPIVVLDNALSAVDAVTERAILERLRKIDQTVVCTTHRLSSALAMDRIIVLENGRITQDEPTHTLLNHPTGWFGTFLAEQRAEEELDARA